MSASTGAGGLEERLAGGRSVVPYLTAGYPTMGGFSEALARVAAVAEAVEIGFPFSDPMADGATIQESSRVALDRGVTMDGVIEALEALAPLPASLVVMSYLNPLMAHGFSSLVPRLAGVGVAALVVPDLPLDESGPLRDAAGQSGVGLVSLVTPVTDSDRLQRLGQASEGFTYAVTMTGTTGGQVSIGPEVAGYLESVVEASRAPVLAGFGVRTAEQVDALTEHCHGVIVGSALVEVLGRGEDPVEFLEGLRS